MIVVLTQLYVTGPTKTILHAVNEIVKMKNSLFMYNMKLQPFVHLSAKKLELYEAPTV